MRSSKDATTIHSFVAFLSRICWLGMKAGILTIFQRAFNVGLEIILDLARWQERFIRTDSYRSSLPENVEVICELCQSENNIITLSAPQSQIPIRHRSGRTKTLLDISYLDVNAVFAEATGNLCPSIVICRVF